MNDEEVKVLLAEVLEQQRVLNEQIQSQRAKKDGWDRLAALAPIFSALIIACVGAYFTYTFNQQQLRVQEVQTIEKFIPHLAGSEQSKRAAILAMNSLGDTRLAARVASIFASEGTVSALHSIVETTTDQSNKGEAIAALTKALDTISEKYHEQNKTDQAIAASTEALSIKEKIVGTSNTDILSNLNRLADLYKARGDNAMVEDLLKRTLVLQQKEYGQNSPEAQATLKQLSQLPKQTATTETAPSAAVKPNNTEATTSTTAAANSDEPEVVPVESGDNADQTAKQNLHVKLVDKRKVADTATQPEAPQ